MRNKKYLKFISSMPCIICLLPAPNDPHHFTFKGQKGMGMKSSDYQAISLCHKHHLEVHQYGRQTFLDTHKINEEGIKRAIEYFNQKWKEHDKTL